MHGPINFEYIFLRWFLGFWTAVQSWINEKRIWKISGRKTSWSNVMRYRMAIQATWLNFRCFFISGSRFKFRSWHQLQVSRFRYLKFSSVTSITVTQNRASLLPSTLSQNFRSLILLPFDTAYSELGEGWKRSVGLIMWEIKMYYLESRSRGISYMKYVNGRWTGSVTFCVQTAFYNGLLKER